MSRFTDDDENYSESYYQIFHPELCDENGQYIYKDVTDKEWIQFIYDYINR